MGVADILGDVGRGIATGARAVGAVAKPLAEGIVNEEAGYAPQIATEKRKHAEQMEDAAIEAKAKELESQLALGQKYGTLNPQQHQQYVDAITNLYSHPRHAGTLMEKLRKAIHPNGAVAQGPQASLPNAIPAGGTGQADVDLANQKKQSRPVPGVHPFKGPDGKYYQPMYTPQGEVVNEEVPGFTPPEQKGAGKSPPVVGSALPQDAVGANGDPIPPEDRNAGKSFVEYQGKWWPVAKQKPVLKKVQGHLVLIDAQTGAKLRDIGPVDTAKVTTRQTLQPGDDGQMHLVNLTSVSTPEGASIEVEPENPTTEGQTQGASRTQEQPKTPAKKVGSILPRTGARPAHPPGNAGPVVPGLHSLAQSKNPLYKADVASYKKAKDDEIAATKLASQADLVAQHPDDAVNQKRLAVALERQASGRFTTQALDYIIKAGWGNTIEQWANNPSTGALPKDVMRQLVDGAHENLTAAQQALKDATPPDSGATPPAQPKVMKYNAATGKLE